MPDGNHLPEAVVLRTPTPIGSLRATLFTDEKKSSAQQCFDWILFGLKGMGKEVTSENLLNLIDAMNEKVFRDFVHRQRLLAGVDLKTADKVADLLISWAKAERSKILQLVSAVR